MTPGEFIDNVCKGFTTKDEGFSVKKMIATVCTLAMLVATFIYVDKDNWLLTLAAWIAFITSLLGIGAIEKNITAVNETKQKANEQSPS